jgi:predicted Zn-dependent protease
VAGLAGVAGVAAMLGLGVLTWEQAKIWRDTETLWRHAVSVTPDCLLCRKFLGETLLERGAALSALEQFLLAVEARPAAVGLRVNVAVAYARLGMWPQAIEQYRRVLDQVPGRVDVRHALAVALYATGRPADAIEQLRAATGLRQGPGTSGQRWGSSSSDLGEPAEAARTSSEPWLSVPVAHSRTLG